MKTKRTDFENLLRCRELCGKILNSMVFRNATIDDQHDWRIFVSARTATDRIKPSAIHTLENIVKEIEKREL